MCLKHRCEAGLVLLGKSGLYSQCNRKELEGFQKKSVMYDLHLKEITQAALWRKVCKGQQEKGKDQSGVNHTMQCAT